MDKFTQRFLLFGSILLLGASPLWGQGLRIGFVDSQQVLSGTAEGKQITTELESLNQSKVAQLEGKNAELQELQQRLNNGRSSMNGDAIAQLEGEISQKQRDLQRFQEDARAELNQRQTALLQQMSSRVQAVIDQYAKDNNLAAIFMRDATQAYVDESLDVTADIIRLYDEKHPVGGAAGSSTGQ